jgi:hypothetical protein
MSKFNELYESVMSEATQPDLFSMKGWPKSKANPKIKWINGRKLWLDYYPDHDVEYKPQDLKRLNQYWKKLDPENKYSDYISRNYKNKEFATVVIDKEEWDSNKPKVNQIDDHNDMEDFVSTGYQSSKLALIKDYPRLFINLLHLFNKSKNPKDYNWKMLLDLEKYLGKYPLPDDVYYFINQLIAYNRDHG